MQESFLQVFLNIKKKTIPDDLFSQKKWQMFRILVGTLGNVLWIAALQKLAFSDAVTLSMASSIFTVLGSSLFFGEKIYKTHFFSLGIGLIGVILSVQPTSESFSIYALFPLFSAILFSISLLLVKKISVHQDSFISTFFIVVGMGLLAFPSALYQWQYLSIENHCILLMSGIVYAMVHWTLIQAYTYAHSAFLTPFKFLRFPVALFIGYFAFHQSVSLSIFAGGCMIICSCFLLNYLANVPSFQWKVKMSNKSLKK